MLDATRSLIWAIARSLAPKRRVLLIEEPFDLVQLLAETDVKELVVVSADADPDAPAGRTAKGAVLRLRPDARERARSKDLVVDREGRLSGADVERLLKNDGIYLTAHNGAALDVLPYVIEVTPGRAEALTVGAGEAHLETCVLAEPTDGDAPIFLGSKKQQPECPALVCITAPAAAVADPSDAAELDALRVRIGALEADLDEARGEVANVREAIELAEEQLDTAQTELAERRIEDKRGALLQSRFDEIRERMQAEIEAVRAENRELAAGQIEPAAVQSERDTARAQYSRAAAALLDALAIGGASFLPSPPPSVASSEAIDAWFEAASGAAESVRAAREADQHARQAACSARRAAVRRAIEYAAALETARAEVEAAKSEHRAPPLPSANETDPRVAQLEAALDAERALCETALAAERSLREAAESTREAATTGHRAISAELERIRDRWIETRRDAAVAQLARAAAEEDRLLADEEISRRAVRIAALEAMIAEHERMAVFMSSSLVEADGARAAAGAELRLADENLKLMRRAIERLGGKAPVPAADRD